MAKHKDRKRDRRDTAKLPKRIAGVKVPKSLRKGSTMRKLAASPLVRDMLATALTAAAAAIASKQDGGDGKKSGGAAKAPAGGAIVAAFAAAATDAVKLWRENQPKRDAAADPAPHVRSAGKPASEPPSFTH